MSASQSAAGATPPLVAVVAVHGVADQSPCSTARAVADLLARADGRYQAFQEAAIRIPVDAVPGFPQTRPRRSLMALRGQNAPAMKALDALQAQNQTPEDRSKAAARAYMTEQLREYKPDGQDGVYDTVRLESVRAPEETACRVHVYEAYWADLSRLKSGALSMFLELYQLMFYVCSLGRKTIALAAAEQPLPRWWSTLGWVHSVVEWFLTIAIPIVNLLLLALAGVIFMAALPASSKPWLPWIGVVALALLAALLGGFIAYLAWIRASGGRWPLLGLLTLAAGALAGWLIAALSPDVAPYRILGAIVFLLLEAAVIFLMAAYQQRRFGALFVTLVAVALVTADFGWQLSREGAPGVPDLDLLVGAVLRSAEAVFVVLELCWAVIIVAIALTVLVAWIAPGRRGPGTKASPADYSRVDRLRRAAGTATLSAVLPAVVVLVLNIAVWNAIVIGGRTIVCQARTPDARKASCAAINHTPRGWIEVREKFRESPGIVDAGNMVEELIAQGSGPLGLVLPFLAVASAIAVWSLLPAVLSELSRALKWTRWQAPWLGEALSAGFKAMRWAGLFLYVLFVVLVGGLLLPWWAPGWRGSHPVISWWLFEGGWLPVLLGSAVTLAITASRGPFRFLALGARGALDVALDVTNWLRMHPLRRNPRARICARYASLLRHVCQWTHPVDGSRYRALVIVAHSQGTVITTDLLMFLAGVNDGPLDRLDPNKRDHLPVYLLTVGCPLRQLYSLRFPHLYGWARHVQDEWPGAVPDPNDLRVEHWFNAYRSGDYVGRYLWHPDHGPDRWDAQRQPHPTPSLPVTRSEQCLGPGAHTHYFDETAAAVGKILDDLIADACRCDPAVKARRPASIG